MIANLGSPLAVEISEVKDSPADATLLQLAEEDALSPIILGRRRTRGRRSRNASAGHILDEEDLASPNLPSKALARAAANRLTHAALDPVAGIPEFKVCAVRVEKNGRK